MANYNLTQTGDEVQRILNSVQTLTDSGIGLEDNGAYDVTAHNSGATFADLSSLLSSQNLSTLIPTEVRKGGMSIKFVSSSDNKYMQYRLIAQTFTTDIIQWVNCNVYVSPNTNTTDVAESLIINDKQFNIQDIRLNPLTENLLQYINVLNLAIDDGKWYSNTGYDCKIIKVYSNEVIDIQTQENRVARYAVLKSVGTPIVGETPNFATGYSDFVQVSVNTTIRIKIPTDGQFLYIANNISGVNYYPALIKDSNQSLENIIGVVPELSDYVLGKTFNKGIMYKGYLNPIDGKYQNNSSYGFVVYRVYPGQILKITAQNTKFARYVLLASFDEFYNGLYADICDGTEYENQISANTSVIVTIPSDAKYIIIYDTLAGSSYYPANIELLNGNFIDKFNSLASNASGWLVEKTTNCINLYKGIGDNKYIKYPIQYYQSEYVEGSYPSFYDCWDMDIVKLCHYDGTVMIEDFSLFREGLAECAISVPRGDEQEGNVFVGGGYNGHGFENIEVGEIEGRDCRILINKQKVAEDSVLPLQELISFSILQRTQVCQAYSNTNPFARLIREWWMDNGELRCKVSLTFLRSIDVVDAYVGMMCVYRHQDGDTTKPYITNKCITSDNPFYVYDFSNSPVYLATSQYRNKIIEYGQLGLGFAESIEDTNKLSSGGMSISDNGSTYNKIYFSVGKNFTSNVSQNLYATFKWDIE